MAHSPKGNRRHTMDCETLINKVREHRAIWDKNDEDHSLRKITDRSWMQISYEMGASVSACKKKWKYLRDQFAQEMRKVIMSDDGKRSGWIFYESLMFLKDQVLSRIAAEKMRAKARAKNTVFDEENVANIYDDTKSSMSEDNYDNTDNEFSEDVKDDCTDSQEPSSIKDEPEVSKLRSKEDIENFISEVHKRRALWDDDCTDSTDATSKLWEEIALEFHVDAEICKKKWKHLQFQFSLALRKSLETDEVSVKWPYFQNLLFLKDITMKSIKWDNKRKDEKKRKLFIPEDVVEAFYNSEIQDPISVVEPSISSSVDSSKFKLVDRRDVTKKRHRSETESEPDEDTLFFKSLIPHTRRIPAGSKMAFRCEIQQVVDKFAYGN